MNGNGTHCFVVEERHSIKLLCRTAGIVLLLVGVWVLLSACGVMSVWLTEDEPALFALLGVAALPLGTYVLGAARRSVRIDGAELCYQPSIGKCRCFLPVDIQEVRFTGSGYRLLGYNDKTLARFELDQKNSQLLLQYLREHDL